MTNTSQELANARREINENDKGLSGLLQEVKRKLYQQDTSIASLNNLTAKQEASTTQITAEMARISKSVTSLMSEVRKVQTHMGTATGAPRLTTTGSGPSPSSFIADRNRRSKS